MDAKLIKEIDELTTEPEGQKVLQVVVVSSTGARLTILEGLNGEFRVGARDGMLLIKPVSSNVLIVRVVAYNG